MSSKSKALIKGVPATITTAARGVLQRQCAYGQHAQGVECEECKQNQMTLQRKSENGNAAPSIVYEVLRSPGQPLDGATRTFMEPRFGHDFSHVRVHTDARAAQSAGVVHELAYTVGQDIAFGDGRYEPDTTNGRELLAHELMHAVQQHRSSGIQEKPGQSRIL